MLCVLSGNCQRFYDSVVLTEGHFLWEAFHERFHILTEPQMHTIPHHFHSVILLELFLNEQKEAT